LKNFQSFSSFQGAPAPAAEIKLIKILSKGTDMPRGGKRPGAGRPRGSHNKRPDVAELQRDMQAHYDAGRLDEAARLAKLILIQTKIKQRPSRA
jgi:hypothetical protein